MNIFRKKLRATANNKDTVYIIDINRINNSYVVTAYWGQREAQFLNQQIKGNYHSERLAVARAGQLLKDKLRSKNRYIEAPDTLPIPGLVPLQIVNGAQVHMDNHSVPADRTEVIKIDLNLTTRNIRV